MKWVGCLAICFCLFEAEAQVKLPPSSAKAKAQQSLWNMVFDLNNGADHSMGTFKTSVKNVTCLWDKPGKKEAVPKATRTICKLETDAGKRVVIRNPKSAKFLKLLQTINHVETTCRAKVCRFTAAQNVECSFVNSSGERKVRRHRCQIGVALDVEDSVSSPPRVFSEPTATRPGL